MYSIKGSWVGQTFALASSTGSGGKKTRNRRSKEERKAMVESFIERYQKSNNGTFPSLNLTHKEVGGSYYIVREIVREVIQENRVLGPGILHTNEQNDYASLEHYPLGSISTEPQIKMFSSEESRVTTEVNHNSLSEGFSSNGGLYEHENQSENDDPILKHNPSIVGQELDGSATSLSGNSDDERIEYQLSSSFEKMPGLIDLESDSEQTTTHINKNIQEKGSEELILANVLPVYDEASNVDHLQSSIQGSTESEVEISVGEEISRGTNQPSLTSEECEEIEQLQEITNDMKDGENEQEVKDLSTQIEAEVVVETFPLRSVPNDINGFDQGLGEPHGPATCLKEEKTEEDKLNSLHEAIVSTENGGQATELLIAVNGTVPDTPSENTGSNMATEDIADPNKTFLAAGKKHVNASNGVQYINHFAAATDDSSNKFSPLGTTTTKSPLNVHHDSNFKKGSNPTLNRINLETWEGRSKPDTNPLLALVKSFITAFVKFWTE